MPFEFVTPDTTTEVPVPLFPPPPPPAPPPNPPVALRETDGEIIEAVPVPPAPPSCAKFKMRSPAAPAVPTL